MKGIDALRNRGENYNEKLVEQINQYLADRYMDRAFIHNTTISILESYDIPDAKALLRHVEYKDHPVVIGHNEVSFAMRMLSYCREIRENTYDVFFPYYAGIAGRTE